MVENRALTDSELMLSVAGHDSKAIEQLYDRYSSLLYTLIKKISQEKETAEEILSDVFIIIWNRADHFDSKTSSVFTWLVTLTRNKTIDVLKRKKGGSDLPDYTDEFEIENILPKLSPAIIPLELEEALKKRDNIVNAINGLTDAQQLVLTLSYFEGLGEKAAAEKLKIPAATVRSKLQVAMGILVQKITNSPGLISKRNQADGEEIILMD